jgi:hypothetical protein
MGIFRAPNFRPGYSAGTQIENPGTGGPSGGRSNVPGPRNQTRPLTGPNGNATSVNGAGGYISGFMGFHYAGPPGPVSIGPTPFANQYAMAQQHLFIPGLIKNPKG